MSQQFLCKETTIRYHYGQLGLRGSVGSTSNTPPHVVVDHSAHTSPDTVLLILR